MESFSFIERLFESNVHALDRFETRSEALDPMLDEVIGAKKTLTAALSGEQQALLEAYVDAYVAYARQTERETFTRGFRFGASCILDTFVLKDE